MRLPFFSSRQLVLIALDRGGLGLHAAILAAHGRSCDIAIADDRLERAQHLELFVAQRIGIVGGRRLHGDEAEQLQHVVLDHVAQRAELVVIAARAGADRFGHRELDVVDMGRIPDRLEQRIGKAQRQQVLHRLFAEIVIDAVDLIFLEDLGDAVVDFLRRSEIVAERLFDRPRGHRGDSTSSWRRYSAIGSNRSGATAR